ncbi:unnamed protein product [Closterium sp. Yama58-4]|nr:unnamed protein product [Closterium sp. Yama58-4]
MLRQVVEKKVAVLERALQHVGDSEAVVLTYLHTCSGRDDPATLDAKWRSAIGHSPGRANLWRGYIRWQRGQFASFTVGKIRESFIAAIRALVGRRNQVWRELQQKPNDPIRTRQLAASEIAAVDMLLDSCRFEHQSGHAELAVALLQAETEYAVRPPPLPLSFSEAGKDGAVGGGAAAGAADVAGEDWMKDPGVWQRWAAEERRRESRQWQPMRGGGVVREGGGVEYEDVRSRLFTLSSNHAVPLPFSHKPTAGKGKRQEEQAAEEEEEEEEDEEEELERGGGV